MSKENHPNVNAVGLMLEVQKVLMNSLRGPAEQKKKDLEFLLLNESRKFAIQISELLDDEVGVGDNDRPDTKSSVLS